MEHYAEGTAVRGEDGNRLATISETGRKDKNGFRYR